MIPELKTATDVFENVLLPQTRAKQSGIKYRTEKKKK